jgi:hypothetical protein
MDYVDIYESGTCKALPLRDAWGCPREDNPWHRPEPERQTTPPARGSAPSPALAIPSALAQAGDGFLRGV